MNRFIIDCRISLPVPVTLIDRQDRNTRERGICSCPNVQNEHKGQRRNRLPPPLVLIKGDISETAMHWRKVPETTNDRVFYGVVLALTALIAVSTALLVLHFLA